jgi:hypothetical protein
MDGTAQFQAKDHDREVIARIIVACLENEVGKAIGPLDGWVKAFG